MRCKIILTAVACLLAGACASSDPGPSTHTGSTTASAATLSGTVNLYTSIDQSTVDAMINAWKSQHPGVDVQVFRAATGQINARIAGEQRAGGITADVLWGPDPLTFYGYQGQNLLARWTPSGADRVPADSRTDTFWATTVLQVVLVVRSDAPFKPTKWSELTDPRLRDQVAIPSPTFAASALGMLGYFAREPGYGMDFFRALKANGAIQVDSPDTVIADVAGGGRKAGIALDYSARQAASKGSPIEVISPDPGPIAVYSAAGVVDKSTNPDAAKAFVEFLLSDSGQQVIAEQKRQPITTELSAGGKKSVAPDWARLADSKQQLLDEYSSIFGG